MTTDAPWCDTCRSYGSHLTDNHDEVVRAEYETANHNYNNPPADWDRDDMKWAYEAMLRAKHKMYARRFDVV